LPPAGAILRRLSITQEIGDDPVHQRLRQIMALFDEYPSTRADRSLVPIIGGREGFEPDSDPQSNQQVTDSEENPVADDPLKSP